MKFYYRMNPLLGVVLVLVACLGVSYSVQPNEQQEKERNPQFRRVLLVGDSMWKTPEKYVLQLQCIQKILDCNVFALPSLSCNHALGYSKSISF